ncbi:hypothetical protein [Cupriavidus sp. TMH.W2]|uniref:hypothetical protein n=1 Tax=Cupriavidus sp. TMH.W2 TaxID=3434465 RepID=UPI003D78A8B0
MASVSAMRWAKSFSGETYWSKVAKRGVPESPGEAAGVVGDALGKKFPRGNFSVKICQTARLCRQALISGQRYRRYGAQKFLRRNLVVKSCQT